MSSPALPLTLWRVTVGLILVLGMVVVPTAAGAATYTDGGGAITIDLGADDAVEVLSNGTSYDLTLDGGTWSGSAPGVTGNGTATITVPADAYLSLVFTDSGAGAQLTFGDSVANAFSDVLFVLFDQGGSVDIANPVALTGPESLDLTADGGITIGADVTTAMGDQDYRSPVTLDADVALASTAGGDISLRSTLDGAHTLDLTTAGTTRIVGQVGQTTPPTGVTTDAAGTTEVSSNDAELSGDWTFNDPVVGVGGIRVEALGGGSTTFAQTVSGGDWILTVHDTLTFHDEVSVTGLQVLNLGRTVINGGLVEATLYGLVIGNDITLDSPTDVTTIATLDPGRDIRFGFNANPTIGGATDGVESLVVDATGQVIMHSEVGANPGRLADLTINDTVELASNATRVSNGSIEVAGTLTLAPDDVAEAAMDTTSVNDVDVTLAAAEIDLGGAVSGTTGLTLASSSTSGPIRLGGTADTGAGTLDLTDSDLAHLVDGFSRLTIGSAPAGDVTVESATVTDDLTILTTDAITDADDAGTDLTAPSVDLQGTLDPGSPVGTFTTTGDLTLDGYLHVDFADGTTADRLQVTGSVTIAAGTTLTTTGSTTGSSHADVVVLVDNDGADAVTGTFDGLAEGATVTVDGRGFVLSYVGGDGNDVTLTRDATPPLVVGSTVGVRGDDGWWIADVTVSWGVVENDSTVTSTDGCGTTMVTTDTTGQTFTCTATSAGGTGSTDVVVKRDATAPVVTVTGVTAGGRYPEGHVPTAGCTTTDATSGVATDATPVTTGGSPGGTGTFTVTCDGATDNAGNTGMAAVSYVVYDPNGGVTLTPTNPTPEPTPVVEPDRVGGQSRVETAVLAAQQAFPDPDSAGAVVLVRADGFADAQAGVPLAVDRDAPVLVTQPDALHTAVAAEVDRVLPDGGTVYVLGGDAALSPAVADGLTDAGYEVVRLAGPNRFATAVVIAEELGNPEDLVVADGGSFTDSIVASTAATAAAGTAFASNDTAFAQDGATGTGALLLTAGEVMPPETQAYLDATAASVVTIGQGANAALPDVPTIASSDPAAQSVAVAEAFFPSPTAVGIATTAAFADALAGAATVANPSVGPGPVLLSAPDALPSAVADHISSVAGSVERALLFGGTAALEEAVYDAVAAALTPPEAEEG